MQQEIIIERRKDASENWELVLSTLGFSTKNNFAQQPSDVNILLKNGATLKQIGLGKPHISFSMTVITGHPTQATLVIHNPLRDFCQGIYNFEFRIWAGYSWVIGGEVKHNIINVFTGKNIMDITTQTNGVDVALSIPLHLTPAKVGHRLFDEKITIEDFLKKVLPYSYLNNTEPTMSIAKTKLNQAIQWEDNFGIAELESSLKAMGYIIVVFHDQIMLGYVKDVINDDENYVEIPSNNQNTPVIPNQPFSRDRVSAPTCIHTKYSAIGNKGTFPLDLAFFIPQLVTYPYCTIENISTNINIFESIKRAGRNIQDDRVFKIFKQQISFDSVGQQNSHNLQLFLSTATAKK